MNASSQAILSAVAEMFKEERKHTEELIKQMLGGNRDLVLDNPEVFAARKKFRSLCQKTGRSEVTQTRGKSPSYLKALN